MTPEHKDRWLAEIRKNNGPLKKPSDLLRRAVSSEDFVDTAIIGGVSVADILSGRVAESEIPQDVLDAFHAQYPQYGSSFVQAVHSLETDPNRLMGLVNGVKGKLFEIDYADWLNHGHLPAGFTAELAHNANNAAWDIVIHDAHGHIDQLLQLKATDSLNYAHDAIVAHPNIDVVVPRELYEKFLDDPTAIGHVLDGHETLHHINGHVADAVGHAEAAEAGSHFSIISPAFVTAVAIGMNYRSYRQGRVAFSDALRNVSERGTLAVIASGARWAAVILSNEPTVALPVSIAVRLLGGQIFHNRRRRKMLDDLVCDIAQSREQLAKHLSRPLLEG